MHMSGSTTQTERVADLVELHELCARYMLLCSQFIGDRWLEVFTPDALYNAFGTEYTLERVPALLSAAPRGQLVGNTPGGEFQVQGRATGQQHRVFVYQPSNPT